MARRFLILVLLLASVAGAMCAEEPLKIGVLRGPTALAFAPVISEQGGTSPDVEIYPSPDVLVARIIAGDVDAATIPSNLAAQLYNRGVPVRVVGTFIWGVLYVVGPAGVPVAADGGLSETLAPLKDQEVHVPGRGATPDLVFGHLLAEAGMEGEVALRYGFNQVEIAQLLIAGRARYAVLPEPFVTQVLAASDALAVIVDLQAAWREAAGLQLPQTVLVSVGDLTPGERARLLDALHDSVEKVTGDPAGELASVDDLGLGISTTTARTSLPRLNLRVESAAQSQEAIVEYLRVLAQSNPAAIGGPVPGEEFFW